MIQITHPLDRMTTVYECPERIYEKFEDCCYKYIHRAPLFQYVDPKTNVIVLEGQSILQAWLNQANQYLLNRLRLVYGSIGIGVLDPEYENGHPGIETFEQWEKFQRIQKRPDEPLMVFDCDCWLEDDAGNVYDVASSIFHAVAILHEKIYFFYDNEIIQRMSKRQLALKGLTYVAFPRPVQNKIHDLALRNLHGMYQDLKLRFFHNNNTW